MPLTSHDYPSPCHAPPPNLSFYVEQKHENIYLYIYKEQIGLGITTSL